LAFSVSCWCISRREVASIASHIQHWAAFLYHSGLLYSIAKPALGGVRREHLQRGCIGSNDETKHEENENHHGYYLRFFVVTSQLNFCASQSYTDPHTTTR
jgi:hypothetical protein